MTSEEESQRISESNKLIQIPANGRIYLPDGRVIKISVWGTSTCKETISSPTVKIEGRIERQTEVNT